MISNRSSTPQAELEPHADRLLKRHDIPSAIQVLIEHLKHVLRERIYDILQHLLLAKLYMVDHARRRLAKVLASTYGGWRTFCSTRDARNAVGVPELCGV